MNLAPNGKPSNLTPEQYRLVRTPAFKKWFGDWENSPETASKVVDSNGEPLVVYHGGTKDVFYEFMPSAVDYSYDPPKVVFKEKMSYYEFDEYIQKYGLRKLPTRFWFSKNNSFEGSINMPCFLNIRNLEISDDIFSQHKESKNENLDFYGVMIDVKDDIYFYVTKSTQIKLADGNTTFDGGNPDIRFSDGGLIAPNGKPSNLTPEQYRLVRTPAFKKWFGNWDDNSKNSQMLLDDNGEPLVLWRGADVDHNVFDLNKTWTQRFWFTSSEEYAKMRGRYAKPYFIKSNEKIDLIGKGGVGMDITPSNPLSVYVLDGIGWIANEYVCFNPLQIKLADGSNTTFDGGNPDIRFSDGGLIAPNGKPSNLTPEQYRLVRTPAFISWFGNWINSPETASKVVDSNGEPMIVYHGTYSEKEFFTFRPFSYWTNSYTSAKSFPTIGYEMNEKGEMYSNEAENVWENFDWKNLRVYSCFLNIRKPKAFDFKTEYHLFQDIEIEEGSPLPPLLKSLMSERYDGMRMDNSFDDEEHFIAFNSTQIKLADNITFDSRNPDMRFGNGGISNVGRKSNLTPEQYRLVRTPAFKHIDGGGDVISKELSYPSGSSLDYYNGKIYLTGDDARYISIMDTDFNEIDGIPLFDHSQARIPKKEKRDIETSCLVNVNGQDTLLLIGSGSRTKRKKLFLIPLDTEQVLETEDSTEPKDSVFIGKFIGKLYENGIDDVNIEGSTTTRTHLLLSNRGNKTNPDNFIIATEKDFWTNQHPKITITKLDLPKGLGMSEMTYDPEKDILFFTASVENTSNSFDDGDIGDSFVGYVLDITSKLSSGDSVNTIAPDKLINLPEYDKVFEGHKIEGICLEDYENGYIIDLVSDNDDGKSTMFKMRLEDIYHEAEWNNAGWGFDEAADGKEIAYHGSPVFKEKGVLIPARSGELGAGVYFTRNYKLAENYSLPRGEVRNIAESMSKIGVAQLDLSNLKIKKLSKDDYIKKRGEFYDAEQKLNNGDWSLDVANKAEQKLIYQYEKDGYDGLEVDDEQQGVIFPSSLEKIKLTQIGDGGLIAPNGKPSNLTPKQYQLVRTPEFISWFGDWENDPKNASKIIDENGEPLVARHFSQSSKMHTIFKEKAKKNDWSVSQKGIYFTSLSAKELNDAYNRTGKGILYEVFLNVRNLLDLGIYDTYDFVSGKPVYWKDHHFAMLDKYVNKGRTGDFDDYTEFDKNVDYTSIQDISEKSKNKILKIGYDGIWGNRPNNIYDTIDEIVVFDSKQIKIADGSNTKFDSKKTDIRFSDGGEVVYSPEFKEWFGSSKAVDRQGNPQIYYHGSTEKGITIFDKAKSKSNENTIGQFIYFSKEKDYSSQERFIGKEGVVYEVYLNIRNPLNLFDEVDATDVSRFFRFTGAENRPESFNQKWRGDWSSAFEEILSQNENPDLATAVTKFGYDAVYYHNSAGDEMYAVINSNQVKSAIGNKTFDSKNDNIYAEDGKKIDTDLKKWFNDSKVVNKEGSPLVMWHGGSFSGGKFKGVAWFTSHKSDAKRYAKLNHGTLTSVYLSIKKPYYSGHVDKKTYRETNQAVIYAQKNGYDGVIDLTEDGEILDAVVWDHKNIKLINNNKAQDGTEIVVYHGTDKEYKDFDKKYLGSSYGATPSNMIGFFFTDNEVVAKTYGKNIKSYKIKIKKPYVIDAKGSDYSQFKHKLNEITEKIDRSKYDGVIIKNYRDAGLYSSNTMLSNNYIVFDTSQIKQAENGAEIPVMDEEEYLAVHGASRQGFGDSALHKNRGGASDKAWTKIVDAQAKKDRDLMDLREKLRIEYNEKVAKGEIRPPSHMEKLISTAKGNPEREDVQAARRLLTKRGVSWE